VRKTTSTSAAALVLAASWSVAAAAQNARDGRVMWSAFQCATFAEMSGDTKEHERLFGIGLKAGRQFVEAVQNGQISPEAVRSEVPIGVTMYLGGPSVDFIIGRIFENAMGDAYDDIVKRKNGLPLPTSDWIMDKEARKPDANNKYAKSNCALLR
jgi:hypothetical protein